MAKKVMAVSCSRQRISIAFDIRNEQLRESGRPLVTYNEYNQEICDTVDQEVNPPGVCKFIKGMIS
jgi:hypothetical protein